MWGTCGIRPPSSSWLPEGVWADGTQADPKEVPVFFLDVGKINPDPAEPRLQSASVFYALL